VIGRTLQTSTQLDFDQPAVTSAICNIQPTQAGLNTQGGRTPSGTVTFDWDDTDGMTISYDLSGFATGAHPWHVHDWGNLFDKENGQSVGGHLMGDAVRPTCPNEAGRINDGVSLTFDASGDASGSFTDTQVTFTGANNILGRAIVIHGNGAGDTTTRAATCVIGVVTIANTDPGNPCDDVDCNSPAQGNCTTEWIVTVGQYVCVCADGFSGDHCETDTSCASPGDCPGPSDDASVAYAFVPSLLAVVLALFAFLH